MIKHHFLFFSFFFFVLSVTAQDCKPEYAPLPFSENFETSWLDLCNSTKGLPSKYWGNDPITGENSWRKDDEGTSANWADRFSGWYAFGANGTNRSARFHSSVLAPNSTGSLSLYIDCSTGYATKEVSFYYFNLEGDDSLFVELSVNGGTSFTPLKSFGRPKSWNSWDPETLGFVSSSPNTILRFKGKATSHTYSDINVDEVKVNSVPCFQPASVFAGAMLTTVNLSFTHSNAGNPSGYEYAVTTTAAPPNSGTFTTSASVTVSGLVPSTNYYVHLRSVCSGIGNSNWISQAFKTATANCTPSYTEKCSYDPAFNLLKLFTLKGENGSIIRNENSICSQNYFDYTGSSSVTVAKGKSYSCIIATDTMSTISLWIDFNDDNAFTYDEILINNFEMPVSYELSLHSLYIPLSANTGAHKMRVRMNSGDPCETAYYGQAFDYTVNIIENNAGAAYNISSGTANNCEKGGGVTIDAASDNNNTWIPLLDTANNIIASINANGNNLGRVNVTEYINDGAVRTDDNGKPYLDRNSQISVETQPATNVSIRLYLTKAEFDALKIADPTITGPQDLWLTKTKQACGSLLGQGMLIQPINSFMTNDGYYVEYSIPSFSSFFLHRNASVLPVTLVNFNVTKQKGFNLLTWETATEKDNKEFEIQVSSNGISFDKLTAIKSKAADGNSTGKLSYSYDDSQVRNNKTYYRLKQINKDGIATYSSTILIDRGEYKSALEINKVYPNPVKNVLTLGIVSVVGDKASLIITNTTGGNLISKHIALSTGANNIQLNTSALSAGTYFIKVISTTTGKQVNSKFVKF